LAVVAQVAPLLMVETAATPYLAPLPQLVVAAVEKETQVMQTAPLEVLVAAAAGAVK